MLVVVPALHCWSLALHCRLSSFTSSVSDGQVWLSGALPSHTFSTCNKFRWSKIGTVLAPNKKKLAICTGSVEGRGQELLRAKCLAKNIIVGKKYYWQIFNLTVSNLTTKPSNLLPCDIFWLYGRKPTDCVIPQTDLNQPATIIVNHSKVPTYVSFPFWHLIGPLLLFDCKHICKICITV